MSSVRLFSAMARVLPLVVLCGCGGFHTPPQEVSVGLALTSPALPPRIEADGHLLVMSKLELTLVVSVKSADEGELPLTPSQTVQLPLTQRWTQLARGALPRGDYRQLKLMLSAVTLEGTWDGAAFRLASSKTSDRGLQLDSAWRVEVGRDSALSVVADPVRWMSKGGGELVDPASTEAAEGLMDRFSQSLAAVRDDNHDGVEDASRP